MLRKKISEISKETIERCNLQECISEDGFEKAISGYRLGVLPKLIKLGIVKQELEDSMFWFVLSDQPYELDAIL